jgi:hypothetical protein
MRLLLRFDEQRTGKGMQAVIQELRNGEPSIWLRNDGDDLVVMVNTLDDVEVAIVAARLRQTLAGS